MYFNEILKIASRFLSWSSAKLIEYRIIFFQEKITETVKMKVMRARRRWEATD